MIKESGKEWELDESTTNEIQCKIHNHFIESGNTDIFYKAKVLVLITENINMDIMIAVPKEMMDEDNSTLSEFFVNHIYKPEDKYMTESIDEIIAERDAIPETEIEDVEIFAGRGSNPRKRFDAASIIADMYGGNAKKWFKSKGYCMVQDKRGNQGDGELHWTECEGIGSVWRDIKEWNNMPREFKESDLSQLEGYNAVLTEAGIQLNNGEIFTSQRVVEQAGDCRRALNNKTLQEFAELLLEPDPDNPGEYRMSKRVRDLTDNERKLLWDTEVKGHATVFAMVMRIDDE